ncbi:MAG TPA: DNA repair protein RecN, partial [Bacteroidales bacterium]|nr:DNA repair protein RecN [Bacteroidales bacterium]
ALSLILGKRADTNILNDRLKKCIVEAVFNVAGYDLQHFFETNDIDYDENTVLRREIGTNGKSRAFINDTPVNLDTINELTRKLIDIHSQHENLSLNDGVFQLKVIDSYGNHHEILEDYRSAFIYYRELLKEYNELKESYEKNKAELDYFQFQYNQLAEAKLQVNEQEDLELEQEQLAHAEEIKTNLEEALSILADDASGLISSLKNLQNITSKLRKFLPQTEELSGRLESAYIELKDINSELDNLYHHTTLDPDRLDFVNGRLDMIFTLLKKHSVQTVSQLIDIQGILKRKTDDISNADFRLDELSAKLSKHEEMLKNKSELLTIARKQRIPEIQDKVIKMLIELGIPNAKFIIQHKQLDIPAITGNDAIQFMFTANKNAPLQEVSKIASGGELSRFMLAIKSLISDSVGLPTIIFDEIDTGVAGEIADKVGTIIKKMSEKMQVINITHLPQVASKGDYHYLVYKLDHESSTKTYMKLLSFEERHLEIAKMLSGKELTDAAMENARELLKN